MSETQASEPSPWLGWALTLLFAPGLLYFANPALALILAAIMSLVLNRPVIDVPSSYGKLALQTAIVLLGLRLNIETLWTLSAEYSWAVAAYVVGTIALGLLLLQVLKSDLVTGRLISAGTAICGGTAIATLSPLLGSQPHQTGVALAIVFLLNAFALLVFPLIGEALDLSQLQFGLWSALAIHDTSSVVATAAVYGEEAAEVAATVKLGRTLWLIPLVFIAGAMAGQGSSRARFPGFVLAFVAASAVGSFLPLPGWVYSTAGILSKALLVVALFLVGVEMTRETFRQLKGKLVVHALLLWGIVAPLTLVGVLWMT